MDMKVSPVLKFNEVGWRRTAGVAMRIVHSDQKECQLISPCEELTRHLPIVRKHMSGVSILIRCDVAFGRRASARLAARFHLGSGHATAPPTRTSFHHQPEAQHPNFQ